MTTAQLSLVELRVIPLGPRRTKGFGIFAKVGIRVGVLIWEALGVMPHDNETSHSNLSAVTVALGQNQPQGEERVLVGPLRMINHRCSSFNVEVWSSRYV